MLAHPGEGSLVQPLTCARACCMPAAAAPARLQVLQAQGLQARPFSDLHVDAHILLSLTEGYMKAAMHLDEVQVLKVGARACQCCGMCVGGKPGRGGCLFGACGGGQARPGWLGVFMYVGGGGRARRARGVLCMWGGGRARGVYVCGGEAGPVMEGQGGCVCSYAPSIARAAIF